MNDLQWNYPHRQLSCSWRAVFRRSFSRYDAIIVGCWPGDEDCWRSWQLSIAVWHVRIYLLMQSRSMVSWSMAVFMNSTETGQIMMTSVENRAVFLRSFSRCHALIVDLVMRIVDTRGSYEKLYGMCRFIYWRSPGLWLAKTLKSSLSMLKQIRQSRWRWFRNNWDSELRRAEIFHMIMIPRVSLMVVLYTG